MKTILLVKSGSQGYGLATPESDEDRAGVCLEGMQDALGIDVKPFESEAIPGYDGRTYGLRTFCKLASGGNPNILEMFFLPVIESNEIGQELRKNTEWFWSQKAGHAFLGYIKAQTERLEGKRGQKDVNRPELVAKYGYDTKYAYHILRLSILGLDFLKLGTMRLPFKGAYKDYLMSIREGKMKLGEVLEDAAWYERALKDELAIGHVPEQPNTAAINEWMLRVYKEHWKV